MNSILQSTGRTARGQARRDSLPPGQYRRKAPVPAQVRSRGQAIILIVLAVLSLSSCATVKLGLEFDLQRFQDSIRHGVTTRDEVRRWLGEPVGTGIVVNSNGEKDEEWLYYFGTGTLPSLNDARLQILQVRFDARGIVKAYNWSSTH